MSCICAHFAVSEPSLQNVLQYQLLTKVSLYLGKNLWYHICYSSVRELFAVIFVTTFMFWTVSYINIQYTIIHQPHLCTEKYPCSSIRLKIPVQKYQIEECLQPYLRLYTRYFIVLAGESGDNIQCFLSYRKFIWWYVKIRLHKVTFFEINHEKQILNTSVWKHFCALA